VKETISEGVNKTQGKREWARQTVSGNPVVLKGCAKEI
jgi:hypothetical protein